MEACNSESENMTWATFWQKNKGFIVPPAAALIVLAIFWHNWHAKYVTDAEHDVTSTVDARTDWRKERDLCDKMVPLLLHSTDLIEVTRAGNLVHQMNCGIGNRLP
jgi:hypothetical protein